MATVNLHEFIEHRDVAKRVKEGVGRWKIGEKGEENGMTYSWRRMRPTSRKRNDNYCLQFAHAGFIFDHAIVGTRLSISISISISVSICNYHSLH